MLILIFLGTLGISLLAMWRVKATYAKFSDFRAASGYTGAEAAAQILQAAGIHDVEILEHEESLGDHYDPINKRLVLSSQNYSHRLKLWLIRCLFHQIARIPLSCNQQPR